MNFENFDFKKMEILNFQEQKNYFIKYFLPLANGSHCMLKDGQYEMITDEVLKKSLYQKMWKEKKIILYGSF